MRNLAWLVIGIGLIVIWFVSFVMMHVAKGLIHLLLFFALISLLMQVFGGRSRA